MSVNAIYCRDFKEAGRRYRLKGVLASSITFPTSVIVPAWKANPATFDGDTGGNNRYVKIPSRVIYNVTSTAASFEKLPINWPQAASMKLALKLNNLNGTLLASLKAGILSPDDSGGGTFQFNGGPGGASFTTSTCWTLLCDMGDSTLDVEDFPVLFIGAQRRLPTRKHTANKKTGLKKIEIEVQHLSRMIYEAITPDALRSELLAATYKNVEGPDTQIFDSYYVVNTRIYSHQQKSNENRAFHFRLMDLSAAIQNLAKDAYCSYIRMDHDEVLFSHISPVAVPANSEIGGPLDNLKFYKQTHDGTGDKGDHIPLADLYFLAIITDGDTYDAGNEVGGYISNVGKDPIGIYKYKNMYDWLRDASETGHCKVIWKQFGELVAHVHFSREKDATRDITDTFSQPVSLVAEDFVGTEVTFEQGANVIVGANASIPGAGGSDESAPSYRNPDFGILAEEEASIAVVFHANPSAGDDGSVEFGYLGGSGSFTPGGCDVTAIGFIVNRLAYRASFSGVAPMIRPHHYVEVHDGVTSNAYCIDTIEMPAPGAFSTDDINNGNMKANFWEPLLAVYAVMQQLGGAPYAVSKRLTIAFGHEKQTLYEGEVELEKAILENLGNTCDPDDWPDGTIFEQSGGDYADIPGAPTILSLEIDIKTGRAKIKLLAQGS